MRKRLGTALPAILSGIWVFSSGCLAGNVGGSHQNPDTGVQDTGSPDSGVEVDLFGDPIDGIVEPLGDHPVDYAALLGDELIFAQSGDTIELVSTATTQTLTNPAGSVSAIAPIGEHWIFAGAQGLFVLRDDEIVESPANAQLSLGRIHELLSVPSRGELWVAGASGLAFIDNNTLFELDAGELPTAGAHIVFGPPVDGGAALWVSAASTLYAVRLDGATPVAYVEREDLQVESLAAEATTGRLWVVADRALHSRLWTGHWRKHSLEGVISVEGDGDAVWILTESALYHHEAGMFQKVEPELTMALLNAARGSALLSSADAFVRLHTDTRVDLIGIDPDDVLNAPVTVELRPLMPGRVQSLEATLDDVSLPIVDDEIEIDPTSLADGAHLLKVQASYDDPVFDSETTLRFFVFAAEPPTWSRSIQPLFTEQCALCHGANASARRLDTQAIWIDQFDTILDNIREQRMPLPPRSPLGSDQIELLEAWRATGFLE